MIDYQTLDSVELNNYINRERIEWHKKYDIYFDKYGSTIAYWNNILKESVLNDYSIKYIGNKVKRNTKSSDSLIVEVGFKPSDNNKPIKNMKASIFFFYNDSLKNLGRRYTLDIFIDNRNGSYISVPDEYAPVFAKWNDKNGKQDFTYIISSVENDNGICSFESLNIPKSIINYKIAEKKFNPENFERLFDEKKIQSYTNWSTTTLLQRIGTYFIKKIISGHRETTWLMIFYKSILLINDKSNGIVDHRLPQND